MDGYENAYNQIINSKAFKDNETYGECIIHLLFKYDWEKEYENTYEIADIMQDGACWFNDWWEGQQNIIVKGFLFTDELPPSMFHYIQNN